MNTSLKRLAAPFVAFGILFGARAAVPGSAPLLQAVVKAAETGTPQSVRRLTIGAKGIPWIPTTRGMTMRKLFQPKPWLAATLEPPFTNGGAVAVFHTWHAPESDGDHIHPLVKTPSGWRLGAEISERDTQGYRITHHDLRIRIVPARKTAEISDRFTVIRAAKAQRVVYARISDDFHVSSLRCAGTSIPFKQAGGIVAMRMPMGRSVRLDMVYAGVVDHKYFSAVTKDLAVLAAYYYPTLGRLPSTADVVATVPGGWTAITQGELVSSARKGTETVFHYRNTLPVNYFTLDAGPYTVTSRKVDGKTLYAYLLKAAPGFADSLLDSLAQAMPYFEKRFGADPYTRYSVVDGGAIMGFVALEGYSLATYGTLTLMPSVVAHELSHTWWGGIVPNTYLKSWWNESFARYSDEGFSRMRNNVTEPHPTDRAWWPPLHAVQSAPLSTARDEGSVNAIAYEKGRVVLTLLEREIGQPVFDRCIRAFAKEQRSALDPDWPDFQRVVERTTQAKWGWFFDQWVRRAGWPDVELEDVRGNRTPEGKWEITGNIVQHGAPYRCEVALRFAGVAGEDGTETSAPVAALPDGSMVIFSSTRAFQYTLDHLPAELALDPDLDVPRTMGVNDIAVFDKFGNTMMKHSREEPEPSPFGGM